MKIKTAVKSYKDVLDIPVPARKKPVRPALPLRLLVRMLGSSDLKATDFSYELHGMDRIPDEPCLVLMNHSSFIDLEIASKVLWPHPYSIVCTSDGFVGKERLMRAIGCIPTNKFVTDVGLMSDIKYALRTNRSHVLMYPEASYSFDGRATKLPDRFGVFLKSLKAPVIMIRTCGAFARDPLYNCLQKRKVKVSADVKLLFSAEQIAESSVEALGEVLETEFGFDNFAWQKENGVVIDEAFRADGLERILYKCDACGSEGTMLGSGTRVRCAKCGREHELTELGELKALSGVARFSSVPEWYDWERGEVRREIAEGSYKIDCPVDIRVFRDFRAIYEIGEGRLIHDASGFRLLGPDGEEYYSQGPGKSYSLYSDYYWYELGDMICIGSSEIQYYCFPKEPIPVAKARIAAEELFKLARAARRERKASSKV